MRITPSALIIALLCGAPATALAGPQLDVHLQYSVDVLSGQGGSRTAVMPMVARHQAGPWDLTAKTQWMMVQGRGSDSRDRDLRGIVTRKDRAGIRQGMTDTKISAERSIVLGRGLSLDLLARGTLPTGRVKAGLGSGRYEFMADAGLSGDIARWSLWGGVARRFRTASSLYSGRDITEFYLGAERALGHRTTLRLDYLHQQASEAGQPAERSASLSLARTIRPGSEVELYTARDSGAFGREWVAGIAMHWAIAPSFSGRSD